MSSPPRAQYVQLQLPLDGPPIVEGSPELRMLSQNLQYILPWIMFMQSHCIGRKGEVKFFFRAGLVYNHEETMKGD